MTNISKEIINSTLFTFTDCVKGINFGFIFSYCVMTFCILLGTPANSWCLCSCVCTERKVKQTQVFFLIHVMLELLFCLECAAEMLNIFILKNDTVFTVISFFVYLTWSGRPLIQTCICIEQYLAVLHPVTFLRYKGVKHRITTAVAVWILSFGYTLYQLATVTFPNPVINSMFIITLAVILFCCVSVLHALKHPRPGNSRNQTSRDVGNQQKRNAFNNIFSALLLILFSYLPQALLSIFTDDNTDKILFYCNIAPFMTSFNVCGVVVTPFLKIYREGHLKCLNFQKKK